MNKNRANYILTVLTIAFLLAAPTSHAAAKRFGLGVVIGDPTGLSGEYRLSKSRSIDGALAWNSWGHESLVIQSTYLIYKRGALNLDATPIDFYFGLGFVLISREHWHDHDEIRFGPRVPAGLSHTFVSSPIQIFGELSLALHLIESTAVDIGFGLGIRYFF